MKILVVIPSLGFGGAERLLVTLIPKLIERNYYVEVCIFNNPNDLANELEKYNVKIHNLKLSHRWAVLEAIRKLKKIEDDFKPNILWGHLYFGILYSRILKLFRKNIKVLSVLHYSISSDSQKKGVWYSFRNYIFKISQKLDYRTIAVSKSIKVDYEGFFKWKNIDVIFNALDLEHIDKSINISDREIEIFRNKYLNNNSGILVTLPGRIHESKGHKYLIEAKNILKLKFNINIKLIFIGSGPNKDNLLELVKNDENIEFLDNLPQEELFKLLKASDFIVIPSLFEAFGLVAIEAMYIEKPTVTTKIDGLVEITKDNYDTLQVRTKNPQDIADAIKYYIDNHHEQLRISKNARKTAKKFDVNIIVEQWEKIFKGDKI